MLRRYALARDAHQRRAARKAGISVPDQGIEMGSSSSTGAGLDTSLGGFRASAEAAAAGGGGRYESEDDEEEVIVAPSVPDVGVPPPPPVEEAEDEYDDALAEAAAAPLPDTPPGSPLVLRLPPRERLVLRIPKPKRQRTKYRRACYLCR